MPYYYYNSTGLLPVLLCAVFALWASHNVNSTFKKYAKQFSGRGITGAQAAQRVLSANGVYGVKILRVDGNLTDHFDPGKNMIFLSDGVYDSTSTAAMGWPATRPVTRSSMRSVMLPSGSGQPSSP